MRSHILMNCESLINVMNRGPAPAELTYSARWEANQGSLRPGAGKCYAGERDGVRGGGGHRKEWKRR